MTLTTFWLGRACVALSVLLVLAIGFEWFGTSESKGTRALRSHLSEMNGKLRFLRSQLRAERVVATQLSGVAIALTAALVRQQWLLLLAVPAIVVGPSTFVQRGVARRVTKVEEQIEIWLNAIANSLKASPSLGEAIASTVSLVPSPMSQEIDVLVKEYEFGTPLDVALDNLGARINSNTLSGTVLALKVARKSGGNLPEMLEEAASALRELARLEGVVRTKTAEGKAQAFVIGVIPLPMVLGIQWMDPQFFLPLTKTFTGNLVVGGVGILWAKPPPVSLTRDGEIRCVRDRRIPKSSARTQWRC